MAFLEIYKCSLVPVDSNENALDVNTVFPRWHKRGILNPLAGFVDEERLVHISPTSRLSKF